MYKDAYEEAQRIIRISDEVRISLETVAPDEAKNNTTKPKPKTKKNDKKATFDKLTTSKLAKKLGISTKELTEKLTTCSYLEDDGNDKKLTIEGSNIGGELKNGRHGKYFLWPENLEF